MERGGGQGERKTGGIKEARVDNLEKFILTLFSMCPKIFGLIFFILKKIGLFRGTFLIWEFLYI